MPSTYLSSVDGNDSDDGSTWALADATLAAALTAAGAGGVVFTDNAHAESQGSGITLTSPGTAAAPTQALCVDRTGNPEPPTALATTAVVEATVGGISFAGHAHYHGFEFIASQNASTAGFGFVSSTASFHRLNSCKLRMTGGHASARVNVGTLGTNIQEVRLELFNTTVEFSNAGQAIALREGSFLWENTPSAIVGTAPTTLFLPTAGGDCQALIRGVDLSALDSGHSLVSVGVNSTGRVHFLNCKLGSSVSVTTGSFAGPGAVEVLLVNCDSGDTNYRYLWASYQGEVSHETTIVRSGGASDGTTSFSRKMVSSANVKLVTPLKSPVFMFWNDSPGSVTVDVEIVNDGDTLTDKEAWVEAEYQGTSGFPLSTFASDRAADDAAYLGTGTNQASSSVTWTTTGLTTPVKQKLSVTFTTAEKGWVQARVKLAKASKTIYVCPKILSTSSRQTMQPDGSIMNEPASGGGGGMKRPVGMGGGLV